MNNDELSSYEEILACKTLSRASQKLGGDWGRNWVLIHWMGFHANLLPHRKFRPVVLYSGLQWGDLVDMRTTD